MLRVIKVKRDGKPTTLTLSQEMYELLSIKLGKAPDSAESLPSVRSWVQAIIKQYNNPKQRNFSQWVAGQVAYFLADTGTQDAYQDWIGDKIISDRQASAPLPHQQPNNILSDSQQGAMALTPSTDNMLSEQPANTPLSDKEEDIIISENKKDSETQWVRPSDIVARIQGLKAASYKAAEIANILTDEQLFTPRIQNWCAKSVSDFLRRNR